MPLSRAEARLLRNELKSHRVPGPHHAHGYPMLPSHIACPHCGRVDEHVSMGSNSSLGSSQGHYWRARHCRCRRAFTVGVTKDGQLQVLDTVKTSQQVMREREAEFMAEREAEAERRAALGIPDDDRGDIPAFLRSSWTEELIQQHLAAKEAEKAVQRPSPEPDTEPAVGAPEGALAREPTPEAASALTGLAEPEKQPEPELNAVPPELLREWAQEDGLSEEQEDQPE